MFTSETLMELEMLQKYLASLRGGYIGLELLRMYSDFGSKVTANSGRGNIYPYGGQGDGG